MSLLPLPECDEYEDNHRMIILELVIFLAMDDESARKYLAILNEDGTVTRDGELLTITYGMGLEHLRPLEQIARAEIDNRIDYVDLLPSSDQVPAVRFALRREFFRLRNSMEFLFWFVTRNPRRPDGYGATFNHSELGDLTRYFTLVHGLDLSEARKRAMECCGKDSNSCGINWEIANPEAYLADPIWMNIRASARKIAGLTGISGSAPDMNLLQLSYQFED